LDGAGATPETASAQVTFATGTLVAGEHTLTGSLEDAAGNSSAFRVRFTVRGTPAPTSLALLLGKAGSSKRGRNQVFTIPVTISTPARVQVTLLSPRGRRLRTKSVQLPAGRRVISLVVPRASLPPGRYTIRVTATTADGTQVVKRAQVTIRKTKAQPKKRRSGGTQFTPSGGAVPDSGSGAPPPPAATPPPSDDRGGSVPPRVSRPETPRPERKPLETATSFVGEKKQRTFGLALVIAAMGGAIGFLIKIELHRLLGRRVAPLA
jgi:hypothetical protein